MLEVQEYKLFLPESLQDHQNRIILGSISNIKWKLLIFAFVYDKHASGFQNKENSQKQLSRWYHKRLNNFLVSCSGQTANFNS